MSTGAYSASLQNSATTLTSTKPLHLDIEYLSEAYCEMTAQFMREHAEIIDELDTLISVFLHIKTIT